MVKNLFISLFFVSLLTGLVLADPIVGYFKVPAVIYTNNCLTIPEAIVSYTAVNGEEWNLVADWGYNSGQKMRLKVNSTVGSFATHAGSFPIAADDLSISWENNEW